ncbi:MAG TPA: hypothetical protein VFL94_06330 [Actinomycetales bacterium]|nr:hypothetical protein [Actinomycetales bacterium]
MAPTTSVGSGDDGEGGSRARTDFWRTREVPSNELPRPVALDAVLARTDDVVVSLNGLLVYRNGVLLQLQVLVRGGSAHEPGAALHGHGDPNARMLLGVELADGRRFSSASSPGSVAPDPTAPLLTSQGGGGDARRATGGMFLTPLPPPPELRIVCAWPIHGVADTITTLPTGPILDAAARVDEVWPWEPYPDGEPVPAPAAPAGSWFSETDEPSEQ